MAWIKILDILQHFFIPTIVEFYVGPGTCGFPFNCHEKKIKTQTEDVTEHGLPPGLFCDMPAVYRRRYVYWLCTLLYLLGCEISHCVSNVLFLYFTMLDSSEAPALPTKRKTSINS